MPEWPDLVQDIKINGKTLTAEVNSEKRAKKIPSEIAKRLWKRATFKRALHESVDAKLEEMAAQARRTTSRPQKSSSTIAAITAATKNSPTPSARSLDGE